MIVRPDLYEEITQKVQKLRDNPREYDARRRLVIDDLHSVGDAYSYFIENPELRMAYMTQGKSESTIKKQANKGIRHIKDAWYYLLNFGRSKSFAEVFTAEILAGTNAIVLGRTAKQGELRVPTPHSPGNVTLNFPDYTVPSAHKVPYLVDSLVEHIHDSFKENPLETAITAHLHIALIQPFFDGNKRTARLIQDRLLFDEGLPPAIIPAGEGKFYHELLEKVAPAYAHNDLEGQRLFYDYIASKVNVGLDTILADISGIDPNALHNI